jgi:hypothetical protein
VRNYRDGTTGAYGLAWAAMVTLFFFVLVGLLAGWRGNERGSRLRPEPVNNKRRPTKVAKTDV